jgi:hypothetical protein
MRYEFHDTVAACLGTNIDVAEVTTIGGPGESKICVDDGDEHAQVSP